jgi:sec-independent protein translocase protein TatA
MIGDILQPTHLLFVLVVALLVLGPKRLPEAGRALGKGIRDFRSAISGEEDHSSAIPTEAAAPPPEAVVPPAAAPPVETTPGPSDTTAESAETQLPEQAETAHPVS